MVRGHRFAVAISSPQRKIEVRPLPLDAESHHAKELHVTSTIKIDRRLVVRGINRI